MLLAVGGRLLPVSADVEGAVRSEVLGARFGTVEERLRIIWHDGVANV
ncbi:MAG: hypothetical protein ACRDQU_15065 [Pseudonocardiaceae bacterium]